MKCKFCAFAATQKQERAYTFTPEELVADAVEQHELTGFTEIHMVNGENPHVDFDFYVDTSRRCARRCRTCTSSCYTASEIHHMTTLSGLTHEEVLRELQAAGLGSLPGGGAEIFADRVRRLVAPGKEHPDIWFQTPPHRARARDPDALHDAVRARRDLRGARSTTCCGCASCRTRPAASWRSSRSRSIPENTVFERRGWKQTAGTDDLKMIAVSRLMLDNIPNMKAYWIMMGMPLAPVALHFGANDVQGTVMRETIFHAAGRGHRDGAEGRRARPLRPRRRADPRAARHVLQRAAALVACGHRRHTIGTSRHRHVRCFRLRLDCRRREG